jgi:hypothetical protein
MPDKDQGNPGCASDSTFRNQLRFLASILFYLGEIGEDKIGYLVSANNQYYITEADRMDKIRETYQQKARVIVEHRALEYNELVRKLKEIESERAEKNASLSKEYDSELEDFQFAPENRDLPVYELWKTTKGGGGRGSDILKAYTLSSSHATDWSKSGSTHKWVVVKKLRNYELSVVKGAATGLLRFQPRLNSGLD